MRKIISIFLLVLWVTGCQTSNQQAGLISIPEYEGDIATDFAPVDVKYQSFPKNRFESLMELSLKDDGEAIIDATSISEGYVSAEKQQDYLKYSVVQENTIRNMNGTSSETNEVFRLDIKITEKGKVLELNHENNLAGGNVQEALEFNLGQINSEFRDGPVSSGDILYDGEYRWAQGDVLLEYSARVLGLVQYNNRPSLICKLSAETNLHDAVMNMNGYQIVDIDTGVSVFLEYAVLVSGRDQGEAITVRVRGKVSTSLNM